MSNSLTWEIFSDWFTPYSPNLRYHHSLRPLSWISWRVGYHPAVRERKTKRLLYHSLRQETYHTGGDTYYYIKHKDGINQRPRRPVSTYNFTFTSHSFNHSLAKFIQIQSTSTVFIRFLEERGSRDFLILTVIQITLMEHFPLLPTCSRVRKHSVIL